MNNSPVFSNSEYNNIIKEFDGDTDNYNYYVTAQGYLRVEIHIVSGNPGRTLRLVGLPTGTTVTDEIYYGADGAGGFNLKIKK